jgi:hypothetical protein
MSKANILRTNVAALLAVLILSAITMLWLFWRHPLSTSIATVMVLAALGVSARLARAIDTDSLTDLEQREQRV